ncbi:MAG TPA: hypothetical protein VIT23_00930 [Terrimicrobiaceae bacterium]
MQHRTLDFLIDRKLRVLHAHRAENILIEQLLHGFLGRALNDLVQDHVVGMEYCRLVQGAKIIFALDPDPRLQRGQRRPEPLQYAPHTAPNAAKRETEGSKEFVFIGQRYA